MNKCVLIGNLVTDIDVKTTQTGKNVAGFRMAVRRPFKNSKGEYESDFFQCSTFFGVDYLSKNAAKGDRVAVEGRIEIRQYTAKDGSNRYSTGIVCDSVEVLKPKGSGFKEVSDEPLPWEV